MTDPFQLVGIALEERFRVDSVVGEGGFGVVYRGHHLRLEHPIAIKCLKIPSHFTAEARTLFLQRFREEGRILLKLGDSPGVPRVFDYGVIPRPHGEIPYLVMEWLDGHTLEAMLASRRAAGLTGLRPEDAVQLMLPAIDVLAVAHEHQIAHRDIKPANLFVVTGMRGPSLKVLDFGIAKAMQEGEQLTQAATHTATNFRAFTPNYAAPEQFAPKRYGGSGPWTDVHALGLVLYEVLTDRSAYPGDDFVECLEAATGAGRPSAKASGAPISDALEGVLARALARSPEHRFRNAGELAAALRHVPEARGGVTGHAPGLMEAPPATERAPAISAMVGHRPSSPQHTPGHSSPPHPLTIHSTTPFGPWDAPQPGVTAHGPPVMPGMPGMPDRSSHGSLVPPVRAQPSRPRPKKTNVALWTIVSLLVVGAAGAGAYVFATRPTPKKKKNAETSTSAEAEDRKVTSKTIHANDYIFQRDTWPLGPATEAELKGKSHVRLIEENGKIVKVERVTPAGNVVATYVVEHKADKSLVRKAYDARNVLMSTYSVSADDIETSLARDGNTLANGCARKKLKFSDKGDLLESSCQDERGHVIIDTSGCQVTAFEVGEHHTPTSMRCLQEDGRPTTDSTGIHMRRFTHDAALRLTEESYYGPTGQSVTSSAGCARAQFTYDAAGNRITETCIGPAGLATAFAGSAASTMVSDHDGNGCLVKVSFRDARGNAVADAGFAGRVFTRDQFCSETGWSTIGAAGALLALPSAAARTERKLDDRGDETELRCFDERNLPTNCWGDRQRGGEGAILRSTRDDKGRVTSLKAFDGSGSPSALMTGYPHETRKTYDDRGLVTEVRYFGADGKPALTLGAVAKRVYKYDALGAEVSNAQFGMNGEAVIDVTGSHEVRRTYDAKHRIASIELRDMNGDYPTKSDIRFGPVIWPRNAVRLTIYREGTRIENRFFDASGKEMSVVDCNIPGRACEM